MKHNKTSFQVHLKIRDESCIFREHGANPKSARGDRQPRIGLTIAHGELRGRLRAVRRRERGGDDGVVDGEDER